MDPIISIKDLNVTYFLGRKQEVKALENVALTIYPGEFVIFFGPSGCGKSTLLYSIAGLETHARGTILVDGSNVATMDTHEAGVFRQKKIGMIFQAFYLISTLDVTANVQLPQMAIGAPVTARAKRATELLEHFGVGTQANKRPTELSGGQQQRVAICRALMNDPDILLADEPVGNLDSKSANDVIELIRDLNAREKKTIILVTHDPSHLHLAHRVFYMRDGHIINVKVNQAINERVVSEAAAAKPQLPHDLDLLVRTFTSLAPDQLGTMLIPYKAKEIVAEIFTGRSVEELNRIEHEVQHLLIDRVTSPGELRRFLDDPAVKGGMGFDHRTAVKISEKIEAVLREIKTLQGEERQQPIPVNDEVRQLRFDLIETFDLYFHDGADLQTFDHALHERLTSTIDTPTFERRIAARAPAHGAGIDWRTARKVAQRLDLIILGKYRG